MLLQHPKLVTAEGGEGSRDDIFKQFALKDLSLVDNQLSVSFIAGIKLLDIFRNHFWNQHVFEQTFSKNFIEEVANDLMHFSFEDYGLRNL